MSDAKTPFELAVIGGGPAGIAAAIALAQTGAKTALIARRAPYADNRTTALLGATVDFLERLEVWPRCQDQAAPLQTMRLVDDTGRLIRAPEVKFSSQEIGLDQFGYNIENRALMAALEQRAAEFANLTRFDDDAEAIDPDEAIVVLRTAGGTSLSARLVIGADGRQSPSRKAAGIVSYGGVSAGTRAGQALKQTLTALNVMPVSAAVSIPFFEKLIQDSAFAPGDTQDKSAKHMLDELLVWASALAPTRSTPPQRAAP